MITGFFYAFLEIVLSVLGVYAVMVVVRALLSWIHPDPNNPIVRFLFVATEPALKPLRRLVPPEKLGGIDLSPLFLLLLLEFVRRGLAYTFHIRLRWSLF